MITKFNNYIKESSQIQYIWYLDIEKYINNILPKYNNINFNLTSFSSLLNNDNTIAVDSVSLFSIYRQNSLTRSLLIFEIHKKNNIYTFDNKYDFETDDIDLLKNHIKEFFNYYYNEVDITEFDNICNVPVFDIDKYSEFILRFIENEPQQIKYIDIITKFLSKNILNKIKHLINASKFDLL